MLILTHEEIQGKSSATEASLRVREEGVIIPLVTVTGTLRLRYEASRARKEHLRFTLSADTQPIITLPGEDEVLELGISGSDVGKDVAGELPIGSVRRRSFFSTARGLQSIEYLICLARAHLLLRSRAIEVSLAGTNTRRVRRALAALFRGAVSKDIVSRVWRKVKSDWDAWNARSLAAEPIVRLILDGTVVRVRLDRKATSISLLVVIGVREDGQKMMLAVKNMGGESAEAWRTVLDDLIARGLRRPAFLIVDGAPGLEKAIAAVWDGVPVQRCTVHKHRNLLAHAPERLHEEIGADYTDMIYADTPQDIAARRKAFIRKWRLKHCPVADSLEEAGDRLFAFAQLPPSQWRSARTTNAIERLHEEFKRRIKTQTVLPSAETAAMLFWALLASGPINMRKVDGWQTLATTIIDQPIDLAA